MMNADHKTAQMLFAEVLREADQRRHQNELIREAEAYNQREEQRSAVQRLIQRLRSDKPQQETRDARRATAV